jgi:cell division protein FtsQ
VSAPSELFDVSDSPTPAAVTANKRTNKRALGNRPKDTEPGFVSKFATGLRLVVGLAIVVGASTAVAWSIHRYAMTTPRFGIKTVALSGNERLSQDEIVTLGGVEIGKNLFSFDTHEAERAIVKNPWVSTAKVSRVLPATLKIELVERKAAAFAVLGERLFLVTKDGEPFKQVKPEDPIDLPVVTGITASELARDRGGALERIRTAVGVIEKYQTLKIAKIYPPEELHLEPSGHAVLTIGKQGVTLALGLPPYARKLVMASDVVGQLRAKNRLPGIVFLDNEAHPERVVVRMK